MLKPTREKYMGEKEVVQKGYLPENGSGKN
jgi:hypothetical protein